MGPVLIDFRCSYLDDNVPSPAYAYPSKTKLSEVDWADSALIKSTISPAAVSRELNRAGASFDEAHDYAHIHSEHVENRDVLRYRHSEEPFGISSHYDRSRKK
jgi:hypothetical protein